MNCTQKRSAPGGQSSGAAVVKLAREAYMENGGPQARREPPRFTFDLLAAVPRAGEGVNLWLFRAARVWHPYRSTAEIIEMLRAATEGCGRSVKMAEIERAVQRAKNFAWQPGQPPVPQSPRVWPEIDGAAREAIFAVGYGLVDLWEASPVRWADAGPRTEEIVDAIFPNNPLLCVGKSTWDFRTKTREVWRGRMANLQLIAPSPMIARAGRTQDGRVSEHSLANTGERRFLVVEFDVGTADEHAAILLQLAKSAPLTLAVHSGGKSLHGWFYCAGRSDARLRAFMAQAVALGADKAMWTRSQFARMPDGLRENGKRQAVFFFNPGVVK